MTRLLFAAALLAAVPATAAPGDPAVGKSKFAVCSVCHAVTAGAPRKIGPNLAGVVGAPAAARDASFTYSPALKASKIVWTEANLDTWLAGPAKMVPGNKMAFAGFASPQDRANVIAYLKTAK